jgi:hypothetical protein
MKRLITLALLVAGCTADNPNYVGDGGPQPAGDLAGTAKSDLALGGQCPCAKGQYCDVATNTCQPGCVLDGDCTTGHCDVATHQCTAPGQMCGAQTCNPGQVCCAANGGLACADSCGSDMGGGITVMCTGPNDCGHATPFCCAHLTVGPAPACARSATLACEASCPLNFPLTCGATGEAVICQKKSDCTDVTGDTNCCTFNQNGQSGTFCVSDQYTSFAASCFK